MYYILGVSHVFQCAKDTNEEDITRFKEYLHTQCESLGIRCIAEEFNQDAADELGCSEISCLSVAGELNIGHIYCDPNREERAARGITDFQDLRRQQFLKNWSDEEFLERLANDNRIREIYWINRIRESSFDGDDVIIVIGSDHINSFANILDDDEEEYEILDENSFVLED